MQPNDELDVVRRRRNLDEWLLKCCEKMGKRYPGIDFESDYWPVKSTYKTEKANVALSSLLRNFRLKERNFSQVARCLNATYLLESKNKNPDHENKAFGLLARVHCESIFHLSLEQLRMIEVDCVRKSENLNSSAGRYYAYLIILEKIVKRLSDEGVIPPLGYRVLSANKKKLLHFRSQHRKAQLKPNQSEILDCKIAALNDALNAVYDNDPRLSSADRVVIALLGRMMCAPSRVNEVMCSSIDDHAVIEDYAKKTSFNASDLHETYKMLLITMKGSKGAEWGAKPALNFMIDLFHYATSVIISHGQRSRMLVCWYESNPQKIFLPDELEYLRGKDLSRSDVSKIVNVSATGKAAGSATFKALKKKIFVGLNSEYPNSSTRREVELLKFKYVESYLLTNVHKAMDICRKATISNHFQGRLSKMLCLFDRDDSPYLPSAINYAYVHRVTKQRTNASSEFTSIFEKLGITMPVNGEVQIAWIQTHDPRRWLTTQTLRHGTNLSDVLINKWANRLKLGQLKAYDFRTSGELSDMSAMPDCAELDDISKGIQQAATLQESFGLKSDFVTVLDASISVTSMQKVFEAVEDRPIARYSEQLIILYPSQFGICLHQHHETPCRNYESCLPCDNNVVVKGHAPSNIRIQDRAQLLRSSVLRQLSRLVLAHNQGIADEPDQLASHILKLTEKGLSGEQLADRLIDEFHEIAELITDKLLFQRLQEAFVARGYTKRFDADAVKNGALIKYHNPAYHSSPGLQRALESHGGRQQIVLAEFKLQDKYPQFKSIDTNLKDERHLLGIDNESELNDE